MIEKNLTLNLPISLTKSKELLVFIGLSCLSFAIPFTLGHPQWLVGSIVNTCLFSTAFFLRGRYFIPLVIFPSLGVLARGIMFGPFTPFLVYFLPFLWIGNLILVLVFKKLYSYNRLLSIFVSAIVKFSFLIIIANIYFNSHIVPQPFLLAMGANQLYTALIGGLIFLTISNTWKPKAQK